MTCRICGKPIPEGKKVCMRRSCLEEWHGETMDKDHAPEED